MDVLITKDDNSVEIKLRSDSTNIPTAKDPETYIVSQRNSQTVSLSGDRAHPYAQWKAEKVVGSTNKILLKSYSSRGFSSSKRYLTATDKKVQSTVDEREVENRDETSLPAQWKVETVPGTTKMVWLQSSSLEGFYLKANGIGHLSIVKCDPHVTEGVRWFPVEVASPSQRKSYSNSRR